ncbi:pentapeptide repeat-containing protein [Citrobacter sp. HN-141]|uniref:pentapeptide repeat-containing protein n=1 Tax=unclassified Citrobacter TaxID=2644389 RepID=UPI0029654364|nr:MULTISPECIES: pentapeptide repeat-containing protein [unclassified Citrobacter]MDW2643327.1 pentapeptide repeat-containing protein [Citrobacter sp. HN-141]MDW2652674.1 pentapeptide repeat-containing protein [Citrobacter sp. HN-120]MDW2695699.1 pentapeptide repeat-containing protein [Citrobacter sp. HN-144]
MDNINAFAQKHLDILVSAAMSPDNKILHNEATKLHGVVECLKYIFTFGIKDSGEKRLKSVINSLSRSLASEGMSPRKTLNSIIDKPGISIRFTIDKSEKSLQGEYELCINKNTDGAYSLNISEENVSEPLELQLSEAQFTSGARYLSTIYFLDEHNLSEAEQKYIDSGYLDLSGEDLSELDMSDLDLSNADLSLANLTGTNLTTEQLLDTNLIRNNFSEDNQLEAAEKLNEIMLLEKNIFSKYNKLFESIKNIAKPECQQLFSKTLIEEDSNMMVSYSIAGNIIANESILHYTMQKFSEAGMGNLKQINDKLSKLFFEQPAVYKNIIPAKSSLRKITTLDEWREASQSGYFDAEKMALLSQGLRTTTEYKNFIKDLKDDLKSLNITSQESYFKISDECDVLIGKYDYSTNFGAETLGHYTSFYREFGKLIDVIFNKR